MSAKKSKFGFLTEALHNQDESPREEAPALESEAPAEESTSSPALSVVQAAEQPSRPKPKPKAQAPEAPRRVGRPTGKRSDGEHVQVTAYIRRDTHLDVKTALLREQKGRDFSGLVEELLAKWLRSRT